MDFKEFLRIKNTMHEKKIINKVIFYGLIDVKETSKKQFKYKGLENKVTLNQIIDHELKESGKDSLSLKAIKEIIMELDYSNFVSETTMTDRFLIFIKEIGEKKNYTLGDNTHFSYAKSQIPIVIFMLIELGTSQTLLNMYTTKAKQRIIYEDLVVFFKQLHNFLNLYIEDPRLIHLIFNSFVSYFKFDMLISYKTNLEKLDSLYKTMEDYEKIETPQLNRRIVFVNRLDRTLNEEFNKIENTYKEDIINNEKKQNSEDVKFKFLQSLGV